MDPQESKAYMKLFAKNLQRCHEIYTEFIGVQFKGHFIVTARSQWNMHMSDYDLLWCLRKAHELASLAGGKALHANGLFAGVIRL